VTKLDLAGGTPRRLRTMLLAIITVWTPELGPCRIKDSSGVCGLYHLHAHCSKRAANALLPLPRTRR
jgi:hypothetical protein